MKAAHRMIAIIFILSLSLAAHAAEIRAYRLTEPVKLDGKLSEPFWRDDRGVSDFHQRDPIEGAQPSEKTVIDIAYDDAAIYIGARMYDSDPKSIVARLVRKDDDVDSDLFTVYLDPYNDKRTGYYFALNAAGTAYDGTLYNDSWNDNSWDGVWEGKTNIDEKGWTAEFRIPYSQLRFEKKDIADWGINFKRAISRKNENDYLVFTPKNGSGFVSRFPTMVGLEHISPPRRLEILPYVTAKQDSSNSAARDPFHDGSKFNAGTGADMRVGLGTNLTLNATVNPDFGQVEVDPAVVNLGDVETFYNEKRPFFVEGSSIFNFGEGGSSSFWGFNWGGPQFFYSRRIGRPPQGTPPEADYMDMPAGTQILGAGKLTGKIWNGWNLGTLAAVTDREFAHLSTGGNLSSSEVEPLALYDVSRVQREFNGGNQGFGGLLTFTGRNFDDPQLADQVNGHALTGGLDGWTFLGKDKTYVLTGWTGFSRVGGTTQRITDLQESSRHYFQRPDANYVELDPTATTLSGNAGRFTVNKEKGNVIFNSAVGWITPGFDLNDVGFLFRADVINMHAGGGYQWTQPGKLFRQASMSLWGFRSYNFGGLITWQGLYQTGYLEFLNYHSINWSVAYNPDTHSSTRTRGGPVVLVPGGWETDLSYSTDSRKAIVLSAGLHTNLYRQDSWTYFNEWFTLQFKPMANLSLSFSPSYETSHDGMQYLDTIDDPAAESTYGKRYVFGDLNQKTFSGGVRINWTFSPKLSLQFYGQPLISAGDYVATKSLAQPDTYTFDPYIYGSNPDFNVKSLRGNAVLRWEYRPGSTVYFVWTQTREDSEDIGDLNFGNSLHRLWSAPADNIFLVKFTYYWSL